MTTNPTPVRGEVWRIRFDPSEGDEIKKVRTAVVLSENAIGRLRLKIVVPITEWKTRYASFPWFVHLASTATNGLTKGSGADAFQRCDWWELMGTTGLLTLELLESQGLL